MPLTDVACRNAKPGLKTKKLADSGGLYLEVAPSGGKYWRWKYRFLAKEKRMAFGVYPTVSLQEAREARDTARKLLAQGQDPSAVKRHRKVQLELEARSTFELVAREWHDHKKSGIGEKTAETNIKRLENYVFPVIGKYPLKDITTPMIVNMAKDIDKRGAHEIARRAWQNCGQIFAYAVQNGYLATTPVVGSLKHVLKPIPRGHYAAFDPSDLPKFLYLLRENKANLYQQTRLAVELIMLTFVRTSELIKAEWQEIDFENKVWTIPASRMKMRQAHLVPLSRQVLEVLEELKAISGYRTYLFPNRANPRKHMSNNTILMALDRMGYRGKMTGHGFRSIALSTAMERLGYRFEIPDRQLAHRHGDDVRIAYDRAKFLPERIQLMQDWADYLDQLAKQYKPERPKIKAA